MPEQIKCTVRDGDFVEPCDALAKNTDVFAPGFTKTRGIAQWSLMNMKKRAPSRTYFGIKSKAYPDGFLFNHCPFCGEDISAPFYEPDEPASDRALSQAEGGAE